jgi:hypothetical protein
MNLVRRLVDGRCQQADVIARCIAQLRNSESNVRSAM